MSGGFGSLNAGLSALRSSQVLLDVAGSNIANANTTGYARRRAEAVATTDVSMPALWSRQDFVQGRVEIADITRLSDPILEQRVRHEHAAQSYVDVRSTVLKTIESGFDELGDNGLNAALADTRAAFGDLATYPTNDATRTRLLSSASELAGRFAAQAHNLDATADDTRERLVAGVAEVNTAAADLRAINQNIAMVKTADGDASALIDERDRLALRLAELTGATGKERADGGLDMSIGGVPLVAGLEVSTLEVATGASGGAPLTFTLTPPGGNAQSVTVQRGEIGANIELIDVSIASYRTSLDALAEKFATQINTAAQSGFDQDGNTGTALFSFTAGSAATTLAVAITDTRAVVAGSQPGAGDGGVALALSAESDVESGYRSLITGFANQVASASRMAMTQSVATNQADQARDQLSGVNIDEETVSMLTAQRSYEAAARVLNAVDSMLDTLINRTGLVR